ncbi:MAG: DUF433 domain-containing protein [Meiothermus sp.]|nr:DUF433 domain-containing protein [Meiothermus sp.]
MGGLGLGLIWCLSPCGWTVGGGGEARDLLGKPVVVGTRITVEEILRRLAAGERAENILAAHPKLTSEGLRAALLYAAEALGAEAVYPYPERAA